MAAQIFRKALTNFVIGRRKLHVTANLSCFYEKDPKSGYKIIHDKPPPQQDLSIFDRMRLGYEQFKEEFGILLGELKEHFRMDPTFIYRPNEVDVIWRFKDNPNSLDQWVVTCDSDYEQGYSTCK